MSSHAPHCRRLAGLVLLAAFLALPGAAPASVVSRTGGQITITANPGEANDVAYNVVCCYYGIDVTDTAGVTAAGECTQVSPTRADCGRATTPTVTARLGDGDDRFLSDASQQVGSFDIDGGDGSDTINGGTSPDIIRGGPGNDTVDGVDGDDQVFGEDGNDIVKGGPGGDAVSGGAGTDRIEGDGSGWSYLDGGSDMIDSRDGVSEQVTCGYGADQVTADAADVIESGGECERVDVPQAADPAPAPAPVPPGSSLTVAITSPASARIAKLVSARGFGFRLTVSAPCRGTVKLGVTGAEARRVGLARGAVTLVLLSDEIPEAGTYRASLPLKARHRRKLGSVARLRTTLTFSCVGEGASDRQSRKVLFRR